MGAGAGWLRQVVQDRSGRSAWEGLVTHVWPPTSEGHNFFVRASFRVFLNSMEIPLSQDSRNVPMEDSR